MKTIVKSFIENAKKYPDKPAVMDIHGAYTYRMLNERSEVLAREVIKKCLEIGVDVEALRKAGKNGARIAVLLPRTRDYMTALIAVIRAGCALIPLDSEYPKNRINNIISDSQCILCITTKELAAKTDDVPKLIIEDIVFGEENKLTDLDLSDPEIEGFFLYTSGSTGKPKGVVHNQSVFSSFNDILVGSCLPDENDICCCMTMFTFIVSINDLCVPIIVGGSLYIADEKERVNVDALYDVIKKRGITSMFLPPQMFTVMRELHGVLPLKYVIEMFCDRVAASKVYKGKDYTDSSALEYYKARNEADFIHPVTAQKLEFLLSMLAEKGEKETFAYIKKNRKTL